MPRILSEDEFNRQLDKALHYHTSPRNLEDSWNGFWFETFSTLRTTATARPRIYFQSQYSITHWGVNGDESAPLTIVVCHPPDQSSEVVKKATEISLEPLKLVNPDEHKLPDGIAPVTQACMRRLTTGDSTVVRLKPVLQPSSIIISAISTKNIIIPASISRRSQVVSVPDTPTNTVASNPERYPHDKIINKTITADQVLDSPYYLDFAFYAIHDAKGDGPTYTFFGQTVHPRTVYLPMIMELKRVPSRSFGGTMNDWFYYTLSARLSEAYKDIHLKAPVAFEDHPHQKSMIALALVGHWWSFTLLSRGHTNVMWSRAYTSGKGNHDDLLRQLFAAAKALPHDPARHQEGWIQGTLENQQRVGYDKHDCMAASVPHIPFLE